MHCKNLWGDVTSNQIGVPPFVTLRHLLEVPPPSLSEVTSFMDGPLALQQKEKRFQED